MAPWVRVRRPMRARADMVAGAPMVRRRRPLAWRGVAALILVGVIAFLIYRLMMNAAG